MIILIDNYDSFTYNLFQYFGDLNVQVRVYRNDQVTVGDVLAEKPAGLVISPGPGTPDDAGICLDLVTAAKEQNIPLLGVCLGHQCIGQVFGGLVVQTDPMHGKTSDITHTGASVFAGLPVPLTVTRYHSLVVDRDTVPDELEITAESTDGLIMGLRHKQDPIHGVQFHPESIATAHGHAMLQNFTAML